MTIYEFAFMLNENINLTYSVKTQRWVTVIKEFHHDDGDNYSVFAGDLVEGEGDTPINSLNDYVLRIRNTKCVYQGRVMNIPNLDVL